MQNIKIQMEKALNFLKGTEGMVVPKDNSNRIYYTRANHTDALGKAPSLMFVSKPEIFTSWGWN